MPITVHRLFKMTCRDKVSAVLPLALVCALSLFFMTLKATAQTKNTLLVAMHIEPPFSDIVDGSFVGESIVIAKALAKKAGYTARFVYCPVARCFSLLQGGQADIMIAVRKTTRRKQFLNYLEPAIKIQKLPLRFYIRADKKITLDNYQDLLPLTVGVLRGASYFEQFDHDSQITKIPLTTHHQLIDMLLKGRIDTFLEREESIMPLVEQDVYSTQIKLANFAYNESVGSYIVVSKNLPSTNKLKHLSQAFQALNSSGELASILYQAKK